MEGFEKESWLEVELQHPKGWSLAAEAGGFSKGFLRIDSKTAQKLDVKWEKQIVEKKIKPKIQPMLVINNFIEGYAKQLKKKAEIHEKGNAEVCGHNAYFAKWWSGTDIVTLSWVCSDEEKVFLLNYYLEPSEEWEEVSNWLIPGIVCHTSERFWKYRLFGVEFKIPKGYKLFNRRLTLGRPVMIFKDGDKTLVLHWCYFAREYLSKYKNLLEWSKKEIPKEVYAAIRDLNYNKLRPEESGRLIVEEVVQSGLLGRRTIVKTVRIWHEPTFNKILLSGYAGPQENIVDLEELEKSISFEKIGE